MTPISNTRERLVLRSRPILMAIGVICAILLFAAIAVQEMNTGGTEAATGPIILLLMFIAVLVVFVRQVVVVFDRGENMVTLRTLSVLGPRMQRYALTDLSKAEVEQTRNDGEAKSGPLRRAVLVFEGKRRVPITGIFQSGAAAQDAVKTINTWLRRKR